LNTQDHNISPCAIFAYNREDKLLNLIQSLQANLISKETILYIFSDAPKNANEFEKVQKVRKVARSISGFKRVILTERPENFGCARNVISGIDEVLKAHSSLIVLEDDAIVSELFLEYMNKTLKQYEFHNEVWSITGYAYPLNFPYKYDCDTYLHPRWCSKSFAIWSKYWDTHIFDKDALINSITSSSSLSRLSCCGPDTQSLFKRYKKNKIDSYAMWFTLNQVLNSKMTVYPKLSYVSDQGLKDGTHTKNALSHNEVFATGLAKIYAVKEDNAMSACFMRYLQGYIIRAYIYRLKTFLGFSYE
tara:strand:- start:4048 stop:4959 length:912 start_codon:yes stop_codon:yes gene_type:complete